MDTDILITKQCFAPVHSRQLWAPVISSGCRLCPSMDLVLLTLGPSNSLHLHRTVSWQKLASLAGDANDKKKTATQVTWSPNGRCMAVAASNQVSLYHIEDLMSTAPSNGSNGMGGGDGSGGLIHSIEEPDTVVGLTWTHVGRPHPHWRLSQGEQLEEETWRYRERYLDRSTFFLPPSSYHFTQEQDDHGAASTTTTSNSTLPSSKTPLSLLCVATAESGIRLYLYGHYHIATLDSPHGPSHHQPITMACSSDLAHLLVASTNNRLRLYSLQYLSRRLHEHQELASKNCSISRHLQAIKTGAKETVASYKAALKPLDAKLENLARLLKNYGVQDSVSKVLLQHLEVGSSSSDDENKSNAVDQFFTGIQMNDQLITRLERSLHGAVANVESLARKRLLAPAQALVFDALQTPQHLEYTTELQQACEILLVSVHACVSQIVEARFRLRDVIAWLRSVGSQIKARGTATDSAQRQNAKKRRVPQAVESRVARYLQQSSHHDTSSITESLVGMHLSDFFAEEPHFVLCERPSKSAQSLFFEETKEAGPLQTPTIAYTARRVSEFVDKVFSQPQEYLSSSVTYKDLLIPNNGDGRISIHTRIGSDDFHQHHSEDPFGKKKTTGLFQPRIFDDQSLYSYCRQWAIVASTGTWLGSDSVELFCLPVGRTCSDNYDDDGSGDELDDLNDGVKFYLTGRLVLPAHCRVKEVAFYGDDGKSSLSSGTDSGTGQEGRQAIGLLVDRGESDEETARGKHVSGALSEELWLLQYEDLVFQPVMVDAEEDVIVLEDNAGEACTAHVQPMKDNHDESMQEDAVIHAKTRQLRMHEFDASSTLDSSTSRLMLSGSRGIGGVFTTVNNCSTLDLFDLEEDDESDDDDDDL